MRDFLVDIFVAVAVGLVVVLLVSVWGCERALVSDGQAVAPGACAAYAWSASQSGEGLVVNLTHDPDGPGGADPVDLGAILLAKDAHSTFRFRTNLGALKVTDNAPADVQARLDESTLTIRLGATDTITAPGLHGCVQETLRGPGMQAVMR
jgi:hypothetical protein